MDNYPLGADKDPNAPWNKKPFPEEELEVTVWVGLQKKVKLKTSDYEKIEEELDGEKYIALDFSNCDIYRTAQEQVDLNFGDWEITEFEVFRD